MFVDCPRCHSKYTVKAEEVRAKQGAEIRCRKCGESFRVIGSEDDLPTQVGHRQDIFEIPSDRNVYLQIIAGEQAGNTFQVLKPVVTLGRGSAVDLPVQDGQVSRKHCVIEITREQAFLRDLGSTNGTVVGGQRIERVAIRDGSEFEIGGTRIRYREVPC